ncbi:hypothetical protein [Flavobacterium sp.]|uniref:hypothetical protein n=1 Tax=Flavobacterium sp. TaxID=239 RepID=UPI00286CA7B9|nr:hypothetical protein [Flavobacterium sp.]
MTKLDSLCVFLLSDNFKKKIEKIIIFLSISSFLLHLIFIILNKLQIIQLGELSKLFVHPIAAIYTPFSFILIYEVYLLVYYLPKSTSIYIGKQYEIILLIVIRRIFKDISNLEFTNNWFNVKYDLIFMYDLAAVITLFYLIFKFYQLNDQNSINSRKNDSKISTEVKKFIKTKEYIATLLVPIVFILSLYSLGNWLLDSFSSIDKLVYEFKDVNKIFFDDFFTLLILVDVFLLLFSFLHSDKFSKVIRNSGFIISTIMIKLSFGTDGILNVILIVMSVVFGIVILAIHNKYDKLESDF